MTDVPTQLDLPALQRRLDGLAVGEALSIASAHSERLFGLNDVALARIERFATGHGCAINVTPSTVIFHKIRRLKR